jgi:hypothetical protein
LVISSLTFASRHAGNQFRPIYKGIAISYTNFKSSLVCPDIKEDPLKFCLSNNLVPSTGLILEFGVFSGNSINIIADKFPLRTIYGFDSFEGLPEEWERDDKGFPLGFF